MKGEDQTICASVRLLALTPQIGLPMVLEEVRNGRDVLSDRRSRVQARRKDSNGNEERRENLVATDFGMHLSG